MSETENGFDPTKPMQCRNGSAARINDMDRDFHGERQYEDKSWRYACWSSPDGRSHYGSDFDLINVPSPNTAPESLPPGETRFDPGKPYTTADGRKVSQLVPHIDDPNEYWVGCVEGGPLQLWKRPGGEATDDECFNLVNTLNRLSHGVGWQFLLDLATDLDDAGNHLEAEKLRAFVSAPPLVPVPASKYDRPGQADAAVADLPFVFTYRNYRGEIAQRRVRPLSFRFGNTEWHPEMQWLMRAFDLDKQAEREFAMADIGALARQTMTEAEVEAAYAELVHLFQRDLTYKRKMRAAREAARKATPAPGAKHV